ncbi:hypothetical protein JXA40_02750 [bacterium]|nr:hypothetical protein [candidate division CSSED10-310 bacterium]
MKLLWLFGSIAALCLLPGCDVFEREESDWPNNVTLTVTDLTECPLDLFVDGDEKGRLEPGESFSGDEFGQGVHLLEAFSWNDDKAACDSIYTDNLNKEDHYKWDILPGSPCGTCDPTPTPSPETTSTPTITPTP